MSKESVKSPTQSSLPFGLEIIDNVDSRGFSKTLKPVKEILPEGRRVITAKEARTILLRDLDLVVANFETGVDFFRREGKYHQKRIVILGTTFRKSGSRVGSVGPDLFVYPVDGGSGNMGWMSLESDEVLTENDYVLVVSRKP